jgi:predicted metal-dependent peptidase
MSVAFTHEQEHKLSVVRLIACEKWWWNSHAYYSLAWVPARGLGTFAVSDAWVLMADPALVDAWSVHEIATVFAHEAEHVLRDHGARRADRDPNVWNCSGDREINDGLIAARWVFPSTHPPLLPCHIDQPDDQLAETYYDADTTSTECAVMLPCGSGAGNPHEQETEWTRGVRGRAPDEREAIRDLVAQRIIEGDKERPGDVSQDALRWATARLRPARIRWQDQLARACRGAVQWRAGATRSTFARPSRRQAGVGFGAGRPCVSGVGTPAPEVAVVVDTSGSMSDAELRVAMSEVSGAMRAVDARVTFCACDCAVYSLQVVRSPREAMALLRGGGGTSFVPAFDALEKRRPRPDVIVFATDGCGDAPLRAPRWCSTVWVLVGQSACAPCAWGRQVFVRE